MNRDPTAGFWRALGLSVLVAAFAALLVIPTPFFGDQALFSVFARMMGDGATLYVDIWDVKQPGIFWFFLAAGSVLGFGEVGVHVVESVYWIAASVLMALALRTQLTRAWIAGLVPLVAPAFYFVVARTNDLTQVEALIGPLIFGVVWFLLPRETRYPPWLRPFAAGFLAGLIAWFKFLALIVPAIVFVVAGVFEFRAGKSAGLLTRRFVVPFMAGLLVPLLALFVWVQANDLWSVVWFTWFEYPPQVLGVNPRPLSRLVSSAGRFAVALGAVGVLALYRVLRLGGRGRNLSILLAAALVGGLVLILLQLWWAYLFMVLLVPLTVLALQGFDDLLDAPRKLLVVLLSVSAIALLPMFAKGAEKVSDVLILGRGGTLQEFQAQYLGYSSAAEEAGAVSINAGVPVYVLGDPRILHILEADQSIPVNGWSPEFWTEEIWRTVADDLGSGGTEALYVSDFASRLAEERAPWFEAEIQASFRSFEVTDRGIWLLPDDP